MSTELTEEDVPHLFDRLETAIDVVLGSLIGFIIAENFTLQAQISLRNTEFDEKLMGVAVFTIAWVAAVKLLCYFIRIKKTAVGFGMFVPVFALLTNLADRYKNTEVSWKYEPVAEVLYSWFFIALFLTVVLRVYARFSVKPVEGSGASE